MQFVRDIADEEVTIEGNEVKHNTSGNPKVSFGVVVSFCLLYQNTTWIDKIPLYYVLI